jgi:hypothetical protein
VHGKTVCIASVGLFGCFMPAEIVEMLQPTARFDSDCSAVSDSIDHAWALALERAKSAYLKHNSRIVKKDRVAVVNYVTSNDSADRLRIYDPTQDWKHLESHWVSHAFKSDKDYVPGAESLYLEQCATQFSNEGGSNFSSKGAMLTASVRYPSEWGKEKLQVDGLDPELNSEVRTRTIVFHQALDKQGQETVFSLGCFMIKPDVIAGVLEQLTGRALVYVHHE